MIKPRDESARLAVVRGSLQSAPERSTRANIPSSQVKIKDSVEINVFLE